MRVVLQRVSRASVMVDGKITGEIEKGYVALLGVGIGDVESDAVFLADKVAELRVMEDENGKMNKGLADVNGAVLAISNFTLYGNAQKGRRPDFVQAEGYERSKELYNCFVERLKSKVKTETGVFGADMKLSLMNDGPVTLIIESERK